MSEPAPVPSPREAAGHFGAGLNVCVLFREMWRGLPFISFHTGAIVREKGREWLAVSRGSRQKVEAVTWEEVEVEAAHNAVSSRRKWRTRPPLDLLFPALWLEPILIS